ncbi:tetratricopeptide repeat protein [Rhizobium sp. L1K21]|nr:tetratricopeptide repeat protein [Rhizobium sp. L1K21]MCO6185052.1 tetratricopeptide repeat protein [Rhizobium sp. L1K21]
MRYLSFALLILLGSLSLPAAALAQSQEPEIVRPLSKEGRLDELFAKLKKARNPTEAGDIADSIWAEWNDSGSATINLIMKWAQDAMGRQDYVAALDFLDQATSLMPTYAEAWNKRATLQYHMGNYKKSMSDVIRVLTLEPRHFGALSGMAIILEDTGRDEQALAVWQRLLEVYPGDRKAQNRVKSLSEKLAGSRT